MMYVQTLRRAAFCTAVALVTLAWPGAYAEQASADTQAWPQWLSDAMAQESRKLKASKVKFGDGVVKTRLAGKPAGKPQPIEDGWFIGSDIGSDAPLECWVFTTVVDPASMAANIAELTMQAMAQKYGPVSNRGLYHVDAGAYGSVPYLALEWLYAVGEPPNKRVGLTKVRVAIDQEASFVCAHNSLGYRETFAAAFEQFVRKAEFDDSAATPYYGEVVLQKVGGQAVGISRSSFALDEDGDTRITTIESSLIPVDGATLQTSDTWYVSFSRPDGTLINQQLAKTENGELAMNLSLAPNEEGDWSVSGTFQGKEITGEIDGAEQPMSELGQMLAVRDLMADPERQSATLSVWAPEADPTRFLEADVELDPVRRTDGHGHLKLGALDIAAQFDDSGSLRSGAMQAGATEITLERVWVGGHLL